ncbi:hypothetical protein P9112_009058 [Eukaryota sp. TZLM1-RC]
MSISRSKVFLYGTYVLIRLVLSYYVLFDDCDETMNYFEPLHYLLYGKGLQTWEYAPSFSLRSYFYLMVFGLPAFIAKLPIFSFIPKPVILHLIRSWLVILFSASELTLFHALSSYSSHFTSFLSIVSLFSSPLIKASVAFLPSSSALFFYNLSSAFTLSDHHWLSLVCVCCSVLWTWPFSGLVFLINFVFNYFKLLKSESLKRVIIKSFLIFSFSLLPQFLLDSYFYGKPVIPSLNIVLYNVFSDTSKGPHLYGVEPWYYYFLNLFVNLGPVLILCFLGVCFLIYHSTLMLKESYFPYYFFPSILLSFSSIIWTIFMSFQPHKEERFISPALNGILVLITYPIACVYDEINAVKPSSFFFRFRKFLMRFCLFILLIPIFYGVFRIAGLYANYGAPRFVFDDFYYSNYKHNHEHNQTICLGKEWYRFQTHFYVPNNFKLEFIKSGFEGHLPKLFLEDNKLTTNIDRKGFNDLNIGDFSVFVDVYDCDYVIDLELIGQNEEYLSNLNEFTVLNSFKFLDSNSSPWYCRIIYTFFRKNAYLEIIYC